MSLLESFHPVVLALLAGGFTWAMTAVGAAIVLTGRATGRKALSASLGFAGGVMIAASYWSLLAPAVEIAEAGNTPAWLPVVSGFLLGALFIRLVDWVLPHVHPGLPVGRAEGVRTRWRRSTLLVLAITLHNIPEGLAVGVAFGAIATGTPGLGLAGAVALTVGIGLQNLPEGCAVAIPLRAEALSARRSFWYGQLSGIVEPVAAVAGAAAVGLVQPTMPYALSFAAGAMIFVVLEDIIPESQRSGNTDLATMGGIGGFALMMLLDVTFS